MAPCSIGIIIDSKHVRVAGNNGNKDSIKTSIINRTEENYAKDIKSFLGKGAIKTEIETDSKVDVTVILGSDY